MFSNTAKEMNCVCVTGKHQVKVIKIQNFCKIVEFKCHEICTLQNRKINVLQKFHVITGKRKKRKSQIEIN